MSSSTLPSFSQPHNTTAGVINESGDTPACDWHQLVIACLLTFIQHDHVAGDMSKTVVGETNGGEIEYKVW